VPILPRLTLPTQPAPAPQLPTAEVWPSISALATAPPPPLRAMLTQPVPAVSTSSPSITGTSGGMRVEINSLKAENEGLRQAVVRVEAQVCVWMYAQGNGSRPRAS
jgi:hypothetical protein